MLTYGYYDLRHFLLFFSEGHLTDASIQSALDVVVRRFQQFRRGLVLKVGRRR